MSVRFAPQWGIVVGVAAVALAGCSTAGSTTSSSPSDLKTESASMEAPHDSMSADPAMEDDAMAVVNDKLKFTAFTATGEAFDGTSLAGVDSILWFWASWCPTCQAEAPGVAAAAAQLPEGVAIYGVPGNASNGTGIDEFISTYELGDMVHIVDGDGSLWENFGVPYQPAFALVNDDGEITIVQGGLGTQGILDAANTLIES